MCSVAQTKTPGLVFPEHPLESDRTTSRHVAEVPRLVTGKGPLTPNTAIFLAFEPFSKVT